MNRTTVVFLALAILLAHALAIHQTPSGDFAPPYERAHVAFELGRGIVQGIPPTAGTETSWLNAYPSPTWVLFASLLERLYLFPTIWSQVFGILCALGTVVVLSEFSPKRLAGLIAPVLLASTGAAAAAGPSGTEAPLAMLLLTLAFLSFERGWRTPLLVSLVALGLTRPEGFACAIVFLLLERFDRPTGLETDGDPRPRRRMTAALLLSIAILLGSGVLRGLITGERLSPFARDLLEFDADQARLGLAWLAGFLRGTPGAVLLLLPILLVLARRAGGTGRRALAVFCGWAGLTVLAGGDELPMWNAIAPGLPLAFLSVQAEFRRWLDRRPHQAPLAWGLLLTTILLSLLASKLPGDFGPVPMERFLEEWMRPTGTLAEAYPRPLGRAGLLEETRGVERLRRVGIFLRDKVSEDARIGSFWPGAIGYLSRCRVFDLLGRRAPVPPATQTNAWSGRHRIDLVHSLEEPVDYLVLTLGTPGVTFSEVLSRWLRAYDTIGDTEERRGEMREALSRYEIVSVPVPASEEDPAVSAEDPFLLLRSRELELDPSLELRLEGGGFTVLVQHRGQRQVVDLAVHAIADDGTRWSLRPTGEWTREEEVSARTDLFLYDSGSREVRLLHAEFPPDLDHGAVTADLHSVGVPQSLTLARAGQGARLVFSR